jgi:hypothetical protein
LQNFKATLLPSPPWGELDRQALVKEDGSVPLGGAYAADVEEEEGEGGVAGEGGWGGGQTHCHDCGRYVNLISTSSYLFSESQLQPTCLILAIKLHRFGQL